MNSVSFAKQTKSSHPTHIYKLSKPFYLVYSDIWGLARIPNLTNTRWFITFIDNHTRVSWVFLMKDKSEAYVLFKRFHQMINNAFQASIHVLRSDNDREYFSNDFSHYLATHGIIHQNSCLYNSQQNRVAKRKNYHLLNGKSSYVHARSLTHIGGKPFLPLPILLIVYP